MNIKYPLETGSDIIWFLLTILYEALKWFTENAGSLGMFILTIFVVLYAKRTLDINKEIVEQERQNIIDSKRPEVVAYFDVEGSSELNFFIANIGKSMAVNVDLNMELIKGNVITDTLNIYYPLKHGISTLAPQQKLKTFFALSGDIKDQAGEYPIYEIKIKYEDTEKRVYNDKYQLNINMFKNRYRITNKEIHDLVTVLEEIKNKMN